jgi:hypothetical protein
MMQSLWPLVRNAVEVILPAGFSTGEVETERLQDLTRLKGKLVFRQNGQVRGILLFRKI